MIDEKQLNSKPFLPPGVFFKCEDSSLRMDTPIKALSRIQDFMYAGLDTGRCTDISILWVSSFEDGKYVTRSVIEKKDATFSEVEVALNELLSIPNVRQCCIDAGGFGMQLAEDAISGFGSHRVKPIVFTPTIRCELAYRLKIAAEDSSFHIPCNEKIHRDFCSIRHIPINTWYSHLISSGVRHSARFWAAALSLHAAYLDIDKAQQANKTRKVNSSSCPPRGISLRFRPTGRATLNTKGL